MSVERKSDSNYCYFDSLEGNNKYFNPLINNITNKGTFFIVGDIIEFFFDLGSSKRRRFDSSVCYAQD